MRSLLSSAVLLRAAPQFSGFVLCPQHLEKVADAHSPAGGGSSRKTGSEIYWQACPYLAHSKQDREPLPQIYVDKEMEGKLRHGERPGQSWDQKPGLLSPSEALDPLAPLSPDELHTSAHQPNPFASCMPITLACRHQELSLPARS